MKTKKDNALVYLFTLYLCFMAFFLILIATQVHASSVSMFAGTATNNVENQRGTAWELEYEHKHPSSPFALSLAYLNEGDIPSHKRDGFAVQGRIYLPVPSDRFEVALGVGGYRWYDTQPKEVVRGFAGMFGVNASYKFTDKVNLRAQWNRIESDDHRDSDVFVAGVGYSWGK